MCSSDLGLYIKKVEHEGQFTLVVDRPTPDVERHTTSPQSRSCIRNGLVTWPITVFKTISAVSCNRILADCSSNNYF